jgi:hypothetical protein
MSLVDTMIACFDNGMDAGGGERSSAEGLEAGWHLWQLISVAVWSVWGKQRVANLSILSIDSRVGLLAATPRSGVESQTSTTRHDDGKEITAGRDGLSVLNTIHGKERQDTTTAMQLSA